MPVSERRSFSKRLLIRGPLTKKLQAFFCLPSGLLAAFLQFSQLQSELSMVSNGVFSGYRKNSLARGGRGLLKGMKKVQKPKSAKGNRTQW